MSFSLRRHIHKLNNEIDNLLVEINDLVMENFELTYQLKRETEKHFKATLKIQNLQSQLKECNRSINEQAQVIIQLERDYALANRMVFDYYERINFDDDLISKLREENSKLREENARLRESGRGDF